MYQNNSGNGRWNQQPQQQQQQQSWGGGGGYSQGGYQNNSTGSNGYAAAPANPPSHHHQGNGNSNSIWSGNNGHSSGSSMPAKNDWQQPQQQQQQQSYGGGKGQYHQGSSAGYSQYNGASETPAAGKGGYSAMDQEPAASGKGKGAKGGKKGGKGEKGGEKGGFKGGNKGEKGEGKGFAPPSLPQPAAHAVPPASLSTGGGGYNPPQRANPNSRTTSTTMSQITTERFADLPISPPHKQALAEVLCYEFMTQVQAKTIKVSLSGSDMLAKAKTGTGKTLAFLIPTLERTLQAPFQQRKGFVSVLVVSPTRELACQIDAEAEQLMKFSKLGHLVVYGGTKIYNDHQSLRRRVPDLLVGTPGRLNDHLYKHDLANKCSRLQSLVFDEADQLLEMGFRPEITKMLDALPPRERRQTLLFSATMPNDVMTIARVALKENFQHVDCVGAQADTHQHVPQSYLITPIETQCAELMQIINEGMEEDPEYKMLVFFTTARVTQFFAELFNKMNYDVLEMHSRKTQAVRTHTSDKFRDSTRVIMFTSDVTARGMDYPDVSKVVQVGLPADKQQYVHRLGRTARAGKAGNGVLLLSDFEEFFVRDLKDQDLEVRRPSPAHVLEKTQAQVDRAMNRLPYVTRAAAYQAWLGFYNSNLKKLRWGREKVVEVANHWITTCCLLSEPPALLSKTVAKMQLTGVPGIITEKKGGGGGGGGGKGGKGGSNNDSGKGGGARGGGGGKGSKGSKGGRGGKW